ncbi:MAG: cobalamin biosynthesis protein CobW [Kiloniella sp.]|nr:cobalamin biosynthesis protein CobW [Kiloniella sp.]RZO30769.1 MAG: cobalamin biosynthesis protein CobW [Rhodospirillaceae bacterium]
MAQKVPVTVVTGFLGAGKTSLIRHWLENAGGRRIALIVNEFGDVGVDGEILRGCGIESCSDDDIMELANGCLCCTVADDFVPTMEALLDRENPPEHIVIETSGLALPKPLVKAVDWPTLRPRVTVDGVVTVVDGRAVADGLFAPDPIAVQAAREADEAIDHETPLEELFEEQLGCADLIIVNKTDLIAEADWSDIEGRVREDARDGAGLIKSSYGAVPPAVALGLDAAAEDDLDSRPSHHDDGHEHDHDDFDSRVFHLGEMRSETAFQAALESIAGNFKLLRAKGFIAIEGKPRRFALQGVGTRFQGYFDREWRPDESRGTAIVCIGEHDLDWPGITNAVNAISA